MKAALKLVGDAPLDIHALNKADIEARDWEQTHIRGDRSKPVELPGLNRIWRPFR